MNLLRGVASIFPRYARITFMALLGAGIVGSIYLMVTDGPSPGSALFTVAELPSLPRCGSRSELRSETLALPCRGLRHERTPWSDDFAVWP